MSVCKVTVVAAVPTEVSGIVLSHIGSTFGRPNVHTALRTRWALDIARRGPTIRILDTDILERRLGPDAVCLPELSNLPKTVPYGFPNRHVIGITTTVVPATIGPELTKLSSSMQAVPVKSTSRSHHHGRK